MQNCFFCTNCIHWVTHILYSNDSYCIHWAHHKTCLCVLSVCTVNASSFSNNSSSKPSDLLYAPCPKVINDNLCESQCMGETQAGGPGSREKCGQSVRGGLGGRCSSKCGETWLVCLCCCVVGLD